LLPKTLCFNKKDIILPAQEVFSVQPIALFEQQKVLWEAEKASRSKVNRSAIDIFR